VIREHVASLAELRATVWLLKCMRGFHSLAACPRRWHTGDVADWDTPLCSVRLCSVVLSSVSGQQRVVVLRSLTFILG